MKLADIAPLYESYFHDNVLRQLLKWQASGKLPFPRRTEHVGDHTYSVSSMTAAALMRHLGFPPEMVPTPGYEQKYPEAEKAMRAAENLIERLTHYSNIPFKREEVRKYGQAFADWYNVAKAEIDAGRELDIHFK